ncbi:phosphatase PAP2 family protein [Microbulbifer epialgicus]|uniref:Phosphatase PAP2 family protein n=1 Tax=Microbulbifer epialgicus TaxID=393907 RepID=A0ABV4P0J8_9GAMM
MKNAIRNAGSALVRLDQNLLKWAYSCHYRKSHFLNILVLIGDAPFWMLSVFFFAVVGEFYNKVALENISILLMFALITSNLLCNPLKRHLKRLRPYADKNLQKLLGIQISNRDPGSGSKVRESFPSGHTIWTSVSVIVICSQFGWPAVPLLGWLVVVMIFLRPHLGVHYPSDALAGLALGSTVGVLTIYLSPALIDLLKYVKEHSLLIFVYWACIGLFLFFGFKLWKHRT